MTAELPRLRKAKDRWDGKSCNSCAMDWQARKETLWVISLRVVIVRLCGTCLQHIIDQHKAES